MERKRSFFERLTGATHTQDEPVSPTKKASLYSRYETEYEDDETVEQSTEDTETTNDPAEAQLAIDMYETNDAIIIKTMTAGVKKEDLQITISRENLTIRGKRNNESHTYQHHYHNQELYWGHFSRTVDLPDEVDVDQATANEHHGLVTIKLPKLDKKRQTTLKVL